MPTFKPQTVRNACVPTTVAMLAGTSPNTVLAVAKSEGVWTQAGIEHTAIPALAACFAVRLGDWTPNLPTEPGTYCVGVDATRLYRIPNAPRQPHCVAVTVRGDGKATVYDGRNPGPVVKMACTVAAATLLCAPVLSEED